MQVSTSTQSTPVFLPIERLNEIAFEASYWPTEANDPFDSLVNHGKQALAEMRNLNAEARKQAEEAITIPAPSTQEIVHPDSAPGFERIVPANYAQIKAAEAAQQAYRDSLIKSDLDRRTLILAQIIRGVAK